MGIRVGLDIGYSNVVNAFGTESELETVIRPAKATPMALLPHDSGLRSGEVVVEVDGELWVAFAAPGRALNGRELHEDYTSSQAYQALFKGALLQAASGEDEIECLVTGLPVHQARNEVFVERLKKRLTGAHQVTPKRSITVKRVEVVAQPVGTLSEVYCNSEHSEVIESSIVLIIDPGFFSVDWVLFDHKELLQESSNSSLKAMSVLLDECSKEIAKDYGGVAGVEKIEHALQSGKKEVLLFGKKVELSVYIERAAGNVIPEVMNEIKQGLRFLKGRAVDCVILGGGGAVFYESFARKEFPDALIISATESVSSNAVGFKFIANN